MIHTQFLFILALLSLSYIKSIRVGTGIGDITGPSVGVDFMGYSAPNQVGSGIHMRLYSRAYIFADDSKTFAFVSVDGGMASDVVKEQVIINTNRYLKSNIFTTDNLCISGTHTHSGPGGFLQYTLYQLNTYGFVNETFTAWVDGITTSLVEAYSKLQEADITLSAGLLYDTNINRSPTSYLLNPLEERNQYLDIGDTDKLMTLLKFRSTATTATKNTIQKIHRTEEAASMTSSETTISSNSNNGKNNYNEENENTLFNSIHSIKHRKSTRLRREGGKEEEGEDNSNLIGILNWFSVHGTSMNNTNTLVSGDNKGYASYLLEKHLNGMHTLPGQNSIICAFASTNLGDVSPNTQGAKCIDTGLPCNGTTSSCNGKCEQCIASGPGRDMFESTQIIGEKQMKFAMNLLLQKGEMINGPIDYRHSFVDMSKLRVTLKNGDQVQLCKPAFGYSFAAGTTDGPGRFDFTQGKTTSNPLWNIIRNFLSKPTAEEITCQAPKPILLNLGDMHLPYNWVPTIMPIQILRLGNLFILCTSTEMTTMAGRRLRKIIKQILIDGKIVQHTQGNTEVYSDVKSSDIHVVIAGLSNSYQSYTTTYEEYQGQRYEAASTLFGSYQLDGLIQEFSRLAIDMIKNQSSTTQIPPSNMLHQQISLSSAPKYDTLPPNIPSLQFGDIVKGHDVQSVYHIGDIVNVVFYGANPRHSLSSYKNQRFHHINNDNRHSNHHHHHHHRQLWPTSPHDDKRNMHSTTNFTTTTNNNDAHHHGIHTISKIDEDITMTVQSLKNNNYKTHMTVERLVNISSLTGHPIYEVVLTDSDWSTKLLWSIDPPKSYTDGITTTSTTTVRRKTTSSHRDITGSEFVTLPHHISSTHHDTTTTTPTSDINNNNYNNNTLHSISSSGSSSIFDTSVVSYITTIWEISSHIPPGGQYRICYQGDAKLYNKGDVFPFVGCSSLFNISE